MDNPKLGTINNDGSTTWPTVTLAGAPFEHGQYDPPPAIVHTLPGGYLAVGDVWPPRDFDVEAALATLKAEVLALGVPSVSGGGKKADSAPKPDAEVKP